MRKYSFGKSQFDDLQYARFCLILQEFKCKIISSVKPYSSSASKKEEVTQMFDGIAPYYDVLNGVLSLGIDKRWRKTAIKHAAAYKPKTILDMATGTADLAIQAAKAIPEACITGVDISSKMIELGNTKLKKKALNDRIELHVGDSENLNFPADSFDLAMASFGVRNFGDLEKGLSEMHRTIKPGGSILVLEFSNPRTFPFKQAFNAYFKYLLPVIGKIKSKDPRAYKYLYESVQAFPDYEKFADVLNKVGFEKVVYKPLSLGICTIYEGVKN